MNENTRKTFTKVIMPLITLIIGLFSGIAITGSFNESDNSNSLKGETNQGNIVGDIGRTIKVEGDYNETQTLDLNEYKIFVQSNDTILLIKKYK